jgi:adenosylcobyric acid synthase
LRIAVIAFPSFSNFTDFDALRSEPSVSLRFCRNNDQLQNADVVILPGSKQTVDDLLWLRARRLDRVLLDHARTGLVVGICGGMQMLGERIVDPHAMESTGMCAGLGLLPIQTNMQAQKVTSNATGQLSTPLLFGQSTPDVLLRGYEIHIGETLFLKQTSPFSRLTRHSGVDRPFHQDGCISADTRIFGTYLHGLFDEDGFRHFFIAAARSFHHLNPAIAFDNWKQKREKSFNYLASTVRDSLDMPRIFAWAGLTYRSQLQSKDTEVGR